MSAVLTSRAPLRAAGRWRAEIVATDRRWHLSVAHLGEGRHELPRYYACDRRRCLELVVTVKRAWRRILFARKVRRGSPGTIVKGVYDVSGGLVEVRPGRLLGDHVRVLGVRLRTSRDVRAFRRAMIASVRLGQRLQAELRDGRGRLA